MSPVLAVANQKGGVGKTTTAVNTGAALADLGHTALLVDLDPQANATSGLGVQATPEQSVYAVVSATCGLREIIQPTGIPGLDIAPAHIDLSAAELELVAALTREYVLRRALEQAALDYDYVLIDCPPSLGLLTLNALCAADAVLIPVQCEFYALAGLAKLFSTITRIRGALNSRLEIAGAVLTMYDGRTNLGRDVVGEMRANFPGHVFATVIPRSVRLAEAPGHGLAASRYDAQSAGAQAYLALARELVERKGKAEYGEQA